MLSSSESLDIAILAVYSPLLLLTLIVIYRHGIHRQSGWIYLSIFCLIRIVGGALGIVGETNPRNVSDIEWSVILGSIGLSPLLLASLGLLKRITDKTSERVALNNTIRKRSRFETVMSYSILGRIFNRLGVHEFATSYRSRFLQLLQLPTMVALILCIVGGIDLTSKTTSAHTTGQKLTKAALIIFLIIYLSLFLLIAKSTAEMGRLPPGEKPVLSALIIALPLLGVRLCFSFLEYFSTISDFSPTSGDVLVRGLMANLEEVLVVIGYILAGMVVPVSRANVVGKGEAEIEFRYRETAELRPAPQVHRVVAR